MANQDIKILMLTNNLKQWQIAHKLGMHDSNFSAMLRTELPEEKKKLIRQAIQELKAEK